MSAILEEEIKEEAEPQNVSNTDANLDFTEVDLNVSTIPTHTSIEHEIISNVTNVDKRKNYDNNVQKSSVDLIVPKKHAFLSELLTTKTSIYRALTEPVLMNVELSMPIAESSVTIRSVSSVSRININNHMCILQMPTAVKYVQTDSKPPTSDNNIEEPALSMKTSNLNSLNRSGQVLDKRSYRSVYLMEILSDISARWDEWAKVKKIAFTPAFGDQFSGTKVHPNIIDHNVPPRVAQDSSNELFCLKSISNDLGNVKKSVQSLIEDCFDQPFLSSRRRFQSESTLKFNESLSFNENRPYCSTELSQLDESQLRGKEESYEEVNAQSLELLNTQKQTQQYSDTIVKPKRLSSPSTRSTYYYKASNNKLRGRNLRKLFKKPKYRIKDIVSNAGKKWKSVKCSVHRKISKYRLKQMIMQPLSWKRDMFNEPSIESYRRRFGDKPSGHSSVLREPSSRSLQVFGNLTLFK